MDRQQYFDRAKSVAAAMMAAAQPVAARLGRAPRAPVSLYWHFDTLAARLLVLAVAVLWIFVLMAWVDPWAQYAAMRLPLIFHWVFQILTEIGRSGWMLWPMGLFIVLALMRWGRGARRFADRVMLALALRLWFVFACVAGSGLAASLVKNMIGRARPPLIAQEGWLSFHPFAFRAIYASFPSGHAVTAMAGAVALSLLLPRHRRLLLVLGGLGAISRVIINAHYLSDVLLGGLWGAAFTLILWRLFARRALVFRPVSPYAAMAMPQRRFRQALTQVVSPWPRSGAQSPPPDRP